MKKKKYNDDQIVKDDKDTYSYRGWLISDHFHRRMFAVVGHFAMGYILIALSISLFLLVITMFI